MSDTDAFDTLRTRVKQQRRELKALLQLIEAAEGLGSTIDLLEDDDEADEVNVELAHDGDVLCAFDVGDLPDLREALLTFCRHAADKAQAAVEAAEAEL